MPQVIVDGLFNQLLTHFDFIGDESKISDSYDRSMDLLKVLENDLKLPVNKRRGQISDESLKKMIGQVKESFSRARPRQEECDKIATKLKEQWSEKFSSSYWNEILYPTA